MGLLEEWHVSQEILNLFCVETSLEISSNKSLILKNEIYDKVENRLSLIILYKFESLENGFKYLGYFLSPNEYHVPKRLWLLNRIESRIGLWCNHWLSLGGRLILLNLVIESILVYWLSLAKIPKSILDHI